MVAIGSEPAPPPMLASTRFGRQGVIALVITVCATFLLASFPAHNADLWLHLAQGRQLVHGGENKPLDVIRSQGLAGPQTWFYDLAAFGIFSVFGGAGLVIVKALLVAALCLGLAWLGCRKKDWTIPAFCAGIASLVISTRILVQPVVLSYCFLALSLWLIQRSGDDETHSDGKRLPPWSMIALFLLWANTDKWFVLGLATVFVSWLGRAMFRRESHGNSWIGAFTRTAVLSLVCLANPRHAFAFLAIFTGVESASEFLSPLSSANAPLMWSSPSGFAFAPLMLFSLLSFLLGRRSRDQILPFCLLAVVGLLQVRALPFFAIIAGPVLSRNLQEYFERRDQDRGERSPVVRFAFRGFAVIIALAFAISA